MALNKVIFPKRNKMSKLLSIYILVNKNSIACKNFIFCKSLLFLSLIQNFIFEKKESERKNLNFDQLILQQKK